MIIFFADLDGLKTINDRYGHREGDNVLIRASHVLKETFRESDIIARIGGDEFVIMVKESPGINIETLNDRLQSNINTHNMRSSGAYHLSLSVGISRYDPTAPPCSLDDLLSQADNMMYRQKKMKLAN